jgi:hypothetical protein
LAKNLPFNDHHFSYINKFIKILFKQKKKTHCKEDLKQYGKKQTKESKNKTPKNEK